ncbi:hypothetical protein SS209_00462 [Salmonella enterica subsp. enterica serovar Senftenberg str. SS209]|nr:hypothetical protein SS209_00462 [Salmonella enterica subsp. enterica serovar Senftenberg str. SS209]
MGWAVSSCQALSSIRKPSAW